MSVDLTNPEYVRLLELCDIGQHAMYHAKARSANDIAVIITQSRQSPGVMSIKCIGMHEDELIGMLEGILEASRDGNYRSLDR